ncbi:polyketide synthase, partial [Streptomyces sp. PT12]
MGSAVDWESFYNGTGARRVDLPTYAFQRQRYWPESAPAITADDDTEFWKAVESGELADLLGPVLPELREWRRERNARSAAESWRYRITWSPLSGLPEPTLTGRRWLVLGSEDHKALADTVIAGLTRHGAEVVTEPTDGLNGVLSLRAPGTQDPAASALADIAAAWDAPLWLATRGAVSVGASDHLEAPDQTAVWGLGRVLGLEQPGRWGGLVDLPAEL